MLVKTYPLYAVTWDRQEKMTSAAIKNAQHFPAPSKAVQKLEPEVKGDSYWIWRNPPPATDDDDADEDPTIGHQVTPFVGGVETDLDTSDESEWSRVMTPAFNVTGPTTLHNMWQEHLVSPSVLMAHCIAPSTVTVPVSL